MDSMLVYVVVALAIIVFTVSMVWYARQFDTKWPKPIDTVSFPRYRIVYRSPRFGSCIHGQCCALCDGLRMSPYSYSLNEARRIQREICDFDTLALTHLRKDEESI